MLNEIGTKMQNPTTENSQYDDEIDLFELWDGLVQEKWLIFIILTITLLGAGFYLLIAKPVYKSEIYFLPPLEKDVQSLNMQNMQNMQNNTRYSTDAVYQQFLQNLQSRSLRKQFFVQNNLYELLADEKDNLDVNLVFQKYFHEKMVLAKPKSKENDVFAQMSFELFDAEFSAQLLNDFSSFVEIKTRNQLFNDARFEIENDRKSLIEQIQGKRALAKQRREDRLAYLSEALAVAKSIGLVEPMINQSSNNLNMEYMRGYKAIQSEIDVLKNRQSDDPFIEGIRNLQEQIAYFDSIKLNEKDIRVVRIDQEAFIPEKPVKPKKALILAVAGVLGLMLGVFIALIRRAVKNRVKAKLAIT